MVENEIIDFLLSYNDKVSGLTIPLRDLLLKILPGIKKQLDKSARIVGYCYWPKYIDSICVMIPSKKGLTLGFYKGTELPDPDKLLKGSGKVHKYVEISSAKEVNSPTLKKLLKEALTAYKKRMSV